MSFVRPELVERLRHWREAIAWSGGLLVGLWLIWRGWRAGAALTLAAGLVVAPVAVALLVAAIRRQRFRRTDLGEGVVALAEGRIGYFGPHGGGFLDLDGLERVEIVSRIAEGGPVAGWVLTDEEGTPLTIPLSARGAAGIYDALSRLPGLDHEAARTALSGRAAGRFRIWSRSGNGGGHSGRHRVLGRLP